MDRFSRPPVLTGAQAQLERDRAFAARQDAERAKVQAKRDAEIEARDAERARKVAEWNAADEQERRERETQLEKDRLARTQEEARVLKDSLRARFLATPGSTPAQFEAVWPELLRQVQIDRTLAAKDPVNQLKEELKARSGAAQLFEARPALVPIETDH